MYESAEQDVLCPFYRWDNKKKKRIACEGLVSGSTVQLSYQSPTQYKRQLSIFCCEHYKKCEIYRMIYELKYREE
jgi:hypothetical protein